MLITQHRSKLSQKVDLGKDEMHIWCRYEAEDEVPDNELPDLIIGCVSDAAGNISSEVYINGNIILDDQDVANDQYKLVVKSGSLVLEKVPK